MFAALVAMSLTATPAAAAHWSIDPENSRITFHAKQMGATVKGRFQRFTVDIVFDPADLSSASATVKIEIGSVDSRNEDRDAQIRGPDWFDAANHPIGLFETRDFEHLGGSDYLARGTLTLRGTTKALDLPFKLDIADNRAQMTAEITVNRTQFGIGTGQWTDTAVVADEVLIEIAVQAEASAN